MGGAQEGAGGAMPERKRGVIRCEAAVIYGHELIGGDVAELCRRLGVRAIPPIVVVVDAAEPDRSLVAAVSDPRLRAAIGDISARKSPRTPASPAEPLRTRDGRVELDMARRQVRVDGADVPLSRLELDLLAYLMAKHGVAIPRTELLESVWGYATGATATVTVHIRQLRRKIEADPNQPVHLLTVRGVGYRFEL